LALEVRDQGVMNAAKEALTYPTFEVIHKNKNPKLYSFLKFNYKTSCIFRGFEHLSSSIGWRIMVEQSLFFQANLTIFVFVKI